jgi:hypothetical protein
LRRVTRECLADVAFEGLDRVRILDHAPAEALASAAADVGVGDDRRERPAGSMLVEDVRAQPLFADRSPAEEEVRVAAKISASRKHRTTIITDTSWSETAPPGLNSLHVAPSPQELLRCRTLLVGRGDQWVTGGALAIATLACARTKVALHTTQTLPALQHPLEQATLALWSASALWLAALLVTELKVPRAGYDTRRWSTVFPVGMYAVSTLATGSVTGIGAFTSVGRVWIWCALAVWLAVLLGMLRRACAFRGSSRYLRRRLTRYLCE